MNQEEIQQDHNQEEQQSLKLNVPEDENHEEEQNLDKLPDIPQQQLLEVEVTNQNTQPAEQILETNQNTISKQGSLQNIDLIPQSPVNELNEPDLNLQNYLEKQIKRYKKIETSCEIEKDKLVLNRIIKTMESQLDKLKNPEQGINDQSNFCGISLIKEMEKSDDQQSITRKNLRNIYNFYSKIYYGRGPSDDFGRINHESHTLSEGKFIIFCRQFGILDERIHHGQVNNIKQNHSQIDDSVQTHKWWLQNKYIQKQKLHLHPEDRKMLQFKELNKLYRKHNNQQNEINFDQFCSLLMVIAKIMFEGQDNYEDQMYNLLEIKNNQYKGKMKSLSIPFNSKEPQGFRKPEGLNEIRKHTQSSKQLETKRQLIEQWKEEKKQELRDKMITQMQSIDKSHSKSIIAEPSYIKHNNYKERQLKKVGFFQKQFNLIDWEKLDKMNPQYLLEQGFNPTDLIEEEEDMEDKYYLKSYDLSRVAEDQTRLNTNNTKQGTTKPTRQRKTVEVRPNISQKQLIKPIQSAYIKLPKLK